MKYAWMLVLLAACGEDAPKTETKNESPRKEDVKSEKVNVVKKEAASPTPEAKASARTGEQVYTQVCTTCHKANGEGMTGVYPPLAGSEWMAKSNETLIKVILHGLMGEIEVKGTKYNNVMSPWGFALNDEEIANVLTHVRSSWGNTGAAVQAEEVTAVRGANAGHAPWQVSEL